MDTANNEYFNQCRPNLSQLTKMQGSRTPSSPSLDTTIERDLFIKSERKYKSPLIYTRRFQESNSFDLADRDMFRYNPTQAVNPVQQTMPAPLSASTTPQVASPGMFQVDSVQTNSPALTDELTAFSFLQTSSQAVPISAVTNNQFLPLCIDPETGTVYMRKENYYVPLPMSDVNALERATNIGFTKPPSPVSLYYIQTIQVESV